MAKKTKIRFFLYNNDSGKFTGIDDGVVCGRTEADISFPGDHLVSREHCRFAIVGNDVYIEDMSSTNETKVNGVAIQSRRKRRLLLNDVVEIGTQRLILTTQKHHPPSNVKDPDQTRVFSAVRRADGSLTS